MFISPFRDQVPLLSVWLSIEETPMTNKVRLLRDVGRNIPGRYKLITILNTVTKKQIEERIAEYDLSSQHVRIVRKKRTSK